MNDYKFDRDEAKRVFFSSDHHFWHKNILKYCERPFETIEEMNETLIRNWNERVTDDDIVFHLGDFCFGGVEKWQNIRAQLNGRIVIILGNHDRASLKTAGATEKVYKLFSEVSNQVIVSVGKRNIILNHSPLLCYGGTHDNRVYQLYGHVHLRKGITDGDTSRIAMTYPCQYDVGVDLNGFRPINYEEVEQKIQAQIQAGKNALMWV